MKAMNEAIREISNNTFLLALTIYTFVLTFIIFSAIVGLVVVSKNILKNFNFNFNEIRKNVLTFVDMIRDLPNFCQQLNDFSKKISNDLYKINKETEQLKHTNNLKEKEEKYNIKINDKEGEIDSNTINLPSVQKNEDTQNSQKLANYLNIQERIYINDEEHNEESTQKFLYKYSDKYREDFLKEFTPKKRRIPGKIKQVSNFLRETSLKTIEKFTNNYDIDYKENILRNHSGVDFKMVEENINGQNIGVFDNETTYKKFEKR
jgi:hypothetical protein